MKSIVSIFSAFLMVMFVSVAVIPEAEAKRFGGGGFGKSFKTSPFSKKKASPNQKQTDQKNGAQQQGKRSGLMGGMLGGLLAGGLFAYLLGSGAFEGLQIMDILLLVGLFFIVMRLLRGAAGAAQAPVSASNGGQGQQSHQAEYFQAQQTMSSSEQNEIPMNLPNGFDTDSFLEVADKHYRELQQAWNDGNLEVIREFVDENLFNALAQQRQSLMVPPQTEILDLSSEIVRADYNQSIAQVSILFRGVCKDDLERSQDGIFDIWHLERDLSNTDNPWLIMGIEAE